MIRGRRSTSATSSSSNRQVVLDNGQAKIIDSPIPPGRLGGSIQRFNEPAKLINLPNDQYLVVISIVVIVFVLVGTFLID